MRIQRLGVPVLICLLSIGFSDRVHGQSAAAYRANIGKTAFNATNGGRLEPLTFKDSSVSARWTSAKCDYFEPEVIDLLLSLNRTIKSSPSISGERTCQGRRRSFKLSGALCQQYRTGKISDTRVLSGIK
jgi:hypothetical protein